MCPLPGELPFRRRAGVHLWGPSEEEPSRNAVKWASFWGSRILSWQQLLIPPVERAGLRLLPKLRWPPPYDCSLGPQLPGDRGNSTGDTRCRSERPTAFFHTEQKSLLQGPWLPQWHESLEKLLFWYQNRDSPKSWSVTYFKQIFTVKVGEATRWNPGQWLVLKLRSRDQQICLTWDLLEMYLLRPPGWDTLGERPVWSGALPREFFFFFF